MAGKTRVAPPRHTSGNIVRDSALGHIPDLLDRYIELNQRLWHDGPLGAALLEIARLRNARKVNCVFCKNARYDIAMEDGLSEDKVAMIDDDFELSELGEREKLVVAFVDLYLNDPAAITPEFQQRMLDEFSREEIVHLSMSLVLCNCFSRFAVAMGGMPDELPRMEISVPE
jgi:alkylhydroperoxidase family enzyme